MAIALRSASPVARYALAGLLVLAAAAVWRNVPNLSPGLLNWAESGNTAAALVEGRGFSDPFGGGTGATAWIPPLFVWIMAAVFLVAGIKTPAAAVALLGLAVLGLAAAHAILIACVPAPARWMRRIASAFFLGAVVLPPINPVQLTSEAWLHILLPIALVWAALEHRRAPRRAVGFVLVGLGGVGPLAHAGFVLALALTLAVLFLLDLNRDRPPAARRAPLFAALAATLAVGAWTARNAAAFGRFVPLKSNFWFELHLANVADPGGLPRAEVVLRQLPFFNTIQFERYAALGELRYVDSFREPSLAALRAAPGRFAANIGRRLANAVVFCAVADGSMITRHAFPPMDFLHLVQAGHLLPLGGTSVACWTRIDLRPAAAHAALAALQLDDFPGAWRDWAEKHTAYQDLHYGAAGLAYGFFIAGLPTLALLAAALARGGRLPAPAAWAALVAAGLLLPFVLVNHSLRHQGPLLALQALVIGAAVEAWLARQRPGA